MFTENTVIVLGAGASSHYWYPTGKELIDRLIVTSKEIFECDIYKRYCAIYKQYKSIDFNEGHIPYFNSDRKNLKNAFLNFYRLYEILEVFYSKLTSFDPQMIDSFLGHNFTLSEVGKALIAYEILQSEGKFTKFDRDAYNRRDHKIVNLEIQEPFNWYSYLVDAILSGCNNEDDLARSLKHLHIITFNYDVSLEHYLYTRLNSIEGFDKKRVKRALEDNVITHVYGKVRQDPFEDEEYGIVFGKAAALDQADSSEPHFKNRLELAKVAGENISVIDQRKQQELKGSPLITNAQEKINAARRLFFLGFGFYRENINLFNFRRVEHNCGVYYTNYKGSKRTQRVIDKLFPRHTRLFFSSERTVLEALDWDFSFID
jgi:hypothetical protein